MRAPQRRAYWYGVTEMIDADLLNETLSRLRRRLLDARTSGGHWEGELSGSALSTATAVWALASVDPVRHKGLIDGGLGWLAGHANADGGWGDTVASHSNISTTLLVWSAFAADTTGRYGPVIEAAKGWLVRRAGSTAPDDLARAVLDRYGDDRTFSVPILSMCALAGKLGEGPDAWRGVMPLPFELAIFPRRWLKLLRLPVVSYALPALVAIGQLRHHFRPPACPVTRMVRNLARGRSLDVLTRIQPADGGFLEAAPLTSFVTMSLAAMGLADHPVVRKGVDFLVAGVRPDGSWPIDTNLATWRTTLSINALGADPLDAPSRAALMDWLLGQQGRTIHPYTHAAPGGWAWTDLPGGVPDADDTAGAMIALRTLGADDPRARRAAADGARWLLGLQNRDGGLPTFCRGWGKLPFDRSGADLTAHAVRAWAAWLADLPPSLQRPARRGIQRAADYLRRSQRPDGTWTPLWFGHQDAPDEQNPTYGTARVVSGLSASAGRGSGDVCAPLGAAVQWLTAARGPDGGWGGDAGVEASVEETALAVEALAEALLAAREERIDLQAHLAKHAEDALSAGAAWLVDRTGAGQVIPDPSPIGFYFAKLWYSERLYPLVFAAGALGRARRLIEPGGNATMG